MFDCRGTRRLKAVAAVFFLSVAISSGEEWKTGDGRLSVAIPAGGHLERVEPTAPFKLLLLSSDETLKLGVIEMDVPADLRLDRAEVEAGLTEQLNGKIVASSVAKQGGQDVFTMTGQSKSGDGSDLFLTQSVIAMDGKLYKVMAVGVGKDTRVDPDAVKFIASVRILGADEAATPTAPASRSRGAPATASSATEINRWSRVIGGISALLLVVCAFVGAVVAVVWKLAIKRTSSTSAPTGSSAYAGGPYGSPQSVVGHSAHRPGGALASSMLPKTVVYVALGVSATVLAMAIGLFAVGFLSGFKDGLEIVHGETIASSAEVADSTLKPQSSDQAKTQSFQEAPGSHAPIDLLKMIDLARDQVRGNFSVDDGGLTIPAVQAAQIELPPPPAESYRLEAVAKRIGGSDSLTIGLIVAKRPVLVVLDGYGGKVSGLSLVDGRSADRNETMYQGNVFSDSKDVHVQCEVRGDRIIVTCDEKAVVDWSGDPNRLSLDERYWKPRTPGRLTLGGWNTEFWISLCTVVALPP